MTFEEQVAAERRHQVSLGWDAEHDDTHGVAHLLHLAYLYAEQGEPVKSAALIVAAQECEARSSERIRPMLLEWFARNV